MPNLQEVWSYINPYMLYGRHLGYKGNFEKELHERNPRALQLFHDVEAVKQSAAGCMKVRAVWRFFEAQGQGNSLLVFEPGAASPEHTFHFSRQARDNGLCLSDYVLDPTTTGHATMWRCLSSPQARTFVRSRKKRRAGRVLSRALDAGAGN